MGHPHRWEVEGGARGRCEGYSSCYQFRVLSRAGSVCCRELPFVSAFLSAYLPFWPGHFTQAAAQSAAATAPAITPEGRWKTIDDKSGSPRRWWFFGSRTANSTAGIDTVLNPEPDNPDHKCIHCSGDMKDKEILGMEILWDMKPNANVWSGGFISTPTMAVPTGALWSCGMAAKS